MHTYTPLATTPTHPITPAPFAGDHTPLPFPAPAARPPEPLSPSSPDWPLFTDYLAGAPGLCGLCEQHSLSLDQLAAWASSPRITAAIETINRLSTLRHRAVAAQAATIATTALIHAATPLQDPEPPDIDTGSPRYTPERADAIINSPAALRRLATTARALETNRKSARALLALHQSLHPPTHTHTDPHPTPRPPTRKRTPPNITARTDGPERPAGPGSPSKSAMARGMDRAQEREDPGLGGAIRGNSEQLARERGHTRRCASPGFVRS